jgi:hypothetical protein
MSLLTAQWPYTAHLSDPFRVLLQEQLKCGHLLWYPLDVIQSVNAYNQLDATEPLLELLDSRLDLRFLDAIDELFGVDTDREGPNVAVLPIELNTVRHSGKREDARARGEEVAGIVVSVEADEVAVKNTQEDFTTDWEDTIIYSGYGQPQLSLLGKRV